MTENTYTDEEFAALKVIAEAHGGGLTREMLEEYGTKLTPDALSLLFAQPESVFHPAENNDDTPSRAGRRQFEEASGWLKLSMRIKGALSRDEEPFGVPFEMVSKGQWEAAIGGQIGENLIRFIAGVSAEQGADLRSAQHIIKRQKRSQKTADAEITTEQLSTLIDQKIMDIAVAFRPLVRFLYAANDLRGDNVVKISKSKPSPNSISLLLGADTSHLSRYYTQVAADSLLPKNDEGKPFLDHLKMWFHKARAADHDSGVNRQDPLIQRSERLVLAVWAGVDAALENYRQGRILKFELPRAIEILQLLEVVDPKHDKKLQLQNSFEQMFGLGRKSVLFVNQLAPKQEEWDFFKQYFGLNDSQIEKLKKLPAGHDKKLNQPSPEYILDHPEHYETFGNWLKAMREASGMSAEYVAEKLDITRARVLQIELKSGEETFGHRQGQVPIPEQYLNADPHGIFPKDTESEILTSSKQLKAGALRGFTPIPIEELTFRERFLALSEPNVMKRQYEEAQNWITRPQLFEALGLTWSRALHDAVLKSWHEATEALANNTRGTIAISGGYIDVKRDGDGELRFHKSSIDKLKSDPEIIAHLARQQEKDKQRG